MSHTDVLIVGAGPSGLALALRLAHHRVPFRIISRAPGPGEASRAMIVHARTLEFYDQLGLAQAAIDAGIPTRRITLRENRRNRATAGFEDMGAGISPYPMMLCLPQDDHERLLVSALEARGHQVEWKTELTELDQDAAGVTATLARRGARPGNEEARVRYLAGCDGAHSTVRHQLDVGFPGGTYDQLFYVADVEIDGGFTPEAFMNLGDQAFALLLPVRSSGTQRLIGAFPAGAQDAEAHTFEDVRPAAEALIGMRVASCRWFSTYRVSHRVAARFRVGRCFLSGDAGHVHSPAGGQGMNTGIGDAVDLSWKLAGVLQQRSPPSLLDTYEPERIAFARTLIHTTDRAFRNLVATGMRGRMLRRVAIPTVMRGITAVPALRRALFRTVSQTRIAYRRSALSTGSAGRVAAGERLPYVPGPGGGNYAALRSMAWQVHVYGEPPAGTASACLALDLELHRQDWSPEAAAAGLMQGAVYLVRPDGHVGLAAKDPAALRSYAAAWLTAIPQRASIVSRSAAE